MCTKILLNYNNHFKRERKMEKILSICVLSILLGSSAIASDYTMTPDGGYIGGNSFHMAPDGSYQSGSSSSMMPDGTYE